MDGFSGLIKERIEALRPKLQDTSRRNPLINNVLSAKSASFVRIVDEKPQSIYNELVISDGSSMQLVPLPPVNIDPPDENTTEFKNAFQSAQATDEKYLELIEKIDFELDEKAIDKEEKADRELKDRIREMLDMPPRPKSEQFSDLINHAKSHGINPSSTLPYSDFIAADDRHEDELLQTLLLPKTFQARMAKILSKARMYQEERGLDVVYIVLGYIKWTLPNAEKKDEFKSPLLLIPVSLDKDKSSEGEIYRVKKLGDPLFNPSLAHKLSVEAQLDFQEIVKIIQTENVDVEEFFTAFDSLKPKNMSWNVMREASFGVYPFQGIELYYDLDTEFLDFSELPVISELMIGKPVSNDGEAGSFIESDVDTEKAASLVPHIVLDADSSQFIALLKVANNENVALEGPPGSGKSQTIVNAIANAIYSNKRVLFVAQKVTALEVVYSRLQSIGLEQFILPMMGGYGGSEDFYEAVDDRLNLRFTSQTRDIESLKKQYIIQREKLASYIDILTKPVVNTGMSVHQVLGLSIANADSVKKLPIELQSINIYPDKYIHGFLPKDLENAAAKVTEWKLQLIDSSINEESVWYGVNPNAVNTNEINEVQVSSRLPLLEIEKLISLQDFESQNLIIDYLNNDLDSIIYEITKASKNENIKKLHSLSRQVGEEEVEEALSLIKKIEDQISTIIKKLKIENEDINKIIELELDILTFNNFLQDFKVETIESDTVSNVLTTLTKKSNLLNVALEIEREIISEIGHSVSPAELVSYRPMADAQQKISNLIEYLRVEGLESAILEFREARKLYKKAIKLVSQDSIPKPNQIQNIRNIINDSGFFSFLSSKTKSAKNLAVDLLEDISLEDSKESILSALDEILAISKDLYNLELSQFFDEFNKEFDKTSSSMALALDELMSINKVTGLGEANSLKIVCSNDLEKITSLINKLKLNNMSWDEIRSLALKFRSKLSQLESSIQALNRAHHFCSKMGFANRLGINELADFSQLAKRLLEDKNKSMVILEKAFDEKHDFYQIFEAFELYKKMTDVSKKLVLETDGNDVLSFFSSNIDTISLIYDNALKLMNAKGLDAKTFSGFSVNKAIHLLKLHKEDQKGLNSIILHKSISNEAESLGFRDLLEKLDSTVEELSLLDTVRASIVLSLRNSVERDYGGYLVGFNGASLSDARKQLQDLDRKIISISPSEVKSKALSNSNPPAGVSYGRKSEYTDLALLKHELQKKRRTPPRKILKRAQSALLELFPCWMMVPTAVAQHLPRNGIFDLVIIDEASQMTPENSISALMRGKNVLIAGDTNQLPPTNFFKGLSSDEDEDEDITTTEESILELANMQFHPKHRLLWHYRSKHEDLIAFSNYYVYDNELVIFPSPNPIMDGMGISLVQINGTFQRGINPAEAQVMLEAIIQFMRETPHRSLGVAVMNQSQMEQLETLILRASEDNKDVSNYIDFWNSEREGLEKFFIKNLENVQGDERDVIFVGTVYGRDPQGKFYQRFGPINGPAGKRRLNVLFSRAKEQIVTFSSIPLSDFNPSPANEGATLLRRWLEFSATKKLGEIKQEHDRAGHPDSPFEDHVIEAVTSLGYQAVPQVGVSSYFIDIGVKHPTYPFGYICGVECDGASYHSSKSARDRDRLREEVLNRLGWDLYRIWSTDWFRDALGCRSLLKKYLDERLALLLQNMPEIKSIPDVSRNVDDSDHSIVSSLDDNQIVQPIPQIEIGSKFLLRYLDGPRAGVVTRFWLQISSNVPASRLEGYITLGKDSPLGKVVMGLELDEITAYHHGEQEVHVQILEIEI